MKIQLTDEAKSDLQLISEKVQGKVFKKISYLEMFPYLGHQMNGVYKGFRCLLAGSSPSYKVIYKIIQNEVVIYYVRHPSRQDRLRVVR